MASTAHQILFGWYSVNVINCIIIVIGYTYFRREEQRLYSERSGRSGQVSIHFKNYLHSRERRTPNQVLQILPLPHLRRSQPLLLPMSYNITRSFIMISHRLKGTLRAEVTKCYISPWDKIKPNFLAFTYLSSDGVIGIFHWQSFRPHYCPGVDSAYNRNE